jgi:glycosyltransferase involved in cell wall biosynthesis
VATRPLILHITGDYPEPTRPPTTFAIKHLIDNVTSCDHVIMSLTRTPDPRRMMVRELSAPDGQRLFALHHFGLPLGVGLFATFHRVAGQIGRLLDAQGLQPDIVHSHRMSFDGIAGGLISRRRGIPHMISVRGQADQKVVRHKPTYRSLIGRTLARAHRVYYVSAWMRPITAPLCKPSSERDRLLPNIVTNTRNVIEPTRPERRFVVAANLDNYKQSGIQESGIQQKGIDRLIAAFARVKDRIPDVTLDIIGVGRPDNAEPLARLVAAANMGDRIRLRPALANKDYLAELPRVLAFTLPSRNETFGMVYPEALFAGVPILYGRGTGIDGHLDGLAVGVGVAPNNVDAIADGLVQLATRNDEFRNAIAAGAPELFRRFDRHAQVAAYAADVEAGVRRSRKDGAIHA